MEKTSNQIGRNHIVLQTILSIFITVTIVTNIDQMIYRCLATKINTVLLTNNFIHQKINKTHKKRKKNEKKSYIKTRALNKNI